jgi:hypothetical protein
MNAMRSLLLVILLMFIFFSCKKSNNSAVATTVTTTTANIDSMTGHYYGVTSGDSIYTYIDSTGKPQQWLRSFSWSDTLIVTSSDSVSITAQAKYYTITFPYGDSLSLPGDSLGLVNNIITNLQSEVTNQNGYATYAASFCDTTIEYDHITINVLYGYSKRISSSFYLYSRP